MHFNKVPANPLDQTLFENGYLLLGVKVSSLLA
jgi:hypothetical protein